GNTSWNAAKADCAALTEGGHTDWKLPSKVVYEGVNINTEKTNLCQMNGNSCGDIEGVFFFALDEQVDFNNGSALSVQFGTFTSVPKEQVLPAVGLRCIR